MIKIHSRLGEKNERMTQSKGKIYKTWDKFCTKLDKFDLLVESIFTQIGVNCIHFYLECMKE